MDGRAWQRMHVAVRASKTRALGWTSPAATPQGSCACPEVKWAVGVHVGRPALWLLCRRCLGCLLGRRHQPGC